MRNNVLPIIIFGSGGASKEIYALIKQINASYDEAKYEILGFIEKDTSEVGSTVCNNVQVIASDDTFAEFIAQFEIIGAIIPLGESGLREKIYRSISKYKNIVFPNIIHPSVIYEKEQLNIGFGNIVCAGNVIGWELKAGNFNLINRSCTLGHDMVMGDYNTINPMTAISGNVTIGHKNLFGVGSVTLQGLNIEDEVIIGAGAVLTKDAHYGEMLIGLPAKPVINNKHKHKGEKGTFIIAEAGVNHNGNLKIAKKLALSAKEAGADAVKYQTFKAVNVVSKYADKAGYQKKMTDEAENQLEMVKKLELLYEEFIELKAYCEQINIKFLSTPFDLESIAFLETLDIDMLKIPSGEITNIPYLIKIAKTRKPIILSTGMSTMDEISYTINILKDNGCSNITLLHCNTEYPTPFEDANISAIQTLKKEFGLEVGYSDHTLGIEAAIAAVALGATVIEKHFTLDKNMDGPDHKASLDPNELKLMICAVRNIEKALGSGEKVPSESELKNKVAARKSIVASCNIRKGETLSEKNITTKRPGNGVSPLKWFEVLGTQATKDFNEDELIEL